MTMGGREVIVGLTSFGDVNCAAGGYDTRVDTLAAWVDTYVAQADPTFSTGGTTPPANSTSPSPSGGAQSPPTSSVTPMPPSSTGTGGVGGSCVRDADCQSHLCGLDDHGGHVCAAAGANGVNGGVGCSVGGARSGGGDRATLLLLVFGLAIKLWRTPRRARR
jgi:hypothetical protein